MSYWLEAFEKPADKTGRPVAETAANLTSGQHFRFHFRPRERGFLYIIAPGAGGNATTTMLTAQGYGQLESNAVAGDADFGFPFGTAKFKLDENAGAEDFTVIFSPTPLLSPAFLAEKAGRKLTPAEVGELEELRAKHKAAGAPAQEVKEEGGAQRVAVSVPEASKGQPVVFDIRINHQ